MLYIYTKDAPTPGNYTQGILDGETLYLSGQTGNDVNLPDEAMVEGGVGPQTYQTLKNLLAVVVAAGGSIHSFLLLHVDLKARGSEEDQAKDFQVFNEAFGRFFAERGVVKVGNKGLPTRKTAFVANLPLPGEGTLVEIWGIAKIPISDAVSEEGLTAD